MTEEQITAYADPEGEAPWAMQVVVHVPKVDTPAHTAVLETVATAVVARIAALEAGTDAEQAALARWRAGRIRKVVRRARGAAWDRAAALTETTTIDATSVCVYQPGPVDQVPAELAKLQVGGFTLTDEQTPEPATALVRLYLNPSLELSTGKAAAQVAHAAQLVYQTATATQRDAWAQLGYTCQVRTACPTLWEQLKVSGQVHVVDAGFTEIEPGSMTVIGQHTL